MKFLLSLLLLLPLAGRSAEWAYIGSRIDSNGCLLKLTFSTAPNLDATTTAVTNLGFFNGFGTNNSLTHTTALTVTITGMGYNPATGTTGIVTSLAYGTILERLPDPLENTNNIIVQNVTNVVLGIWLSEPVFSNDTVSVSALAGALKSTNGAAFTNSAAFTATATNNSVLPYDAAKCITRWTEAPYRIITNTIFYAKLKAFNRAGIASVQVIARDENSNFITNRQSVKQIDYNGIEAIPTAKFIVPMDMSSFTNGDEIRFDFIAEPLRGSAGSVQTTLDGANIRGPNYAPQYFRLDRLNNWGLSWAIVDPTNGSPAGVVSSNATFGAAAAFSSIGQALDACALSNAIWYGSTRSNTANSRIFLVPSKATWLSNTTTRGNPFPNPAPLITSHPTNSQRELAWLHQSINFSDARNKRIHIHDLLVGFTNAFGFTSTDTDHLFLDRVTISSSGQIFNGVTNSYTIGCVISNFPSGWTGTAHSPQIIAGNWHYNTNDCPGRTYGQWGNRRMVNMGTALTLPLVNTDINASVAAPDRAICEGNAYYGLSVASAPPVQFYYAMGCTNGGYFGNNLIEDTNRASGALAVFAASTPNTNSTNMVVEWNLFIGGRVLFAYNDNGDAPWYRVLFALRNNLFDDFNIKGDVLPPGNGARVGNITLINGVSCSGNISPDSGFSMVTEVGFNGLNTYFQDLSAPTNWFEFVGFGAAVDNSQSGTGMGDYRLTSGSRVFKIATQVKDSSPQPQWPHDLGAKIIGATAPAGPHRDGDVRMAGALF